MSQGPPAKRQRLIKDNEAIIQPPKPNLTWSQMPLLPLLTICQFLPYETVFQSLELVNFHFRCITTNKKVHFNELVVHGNPTTHHLQQLINRTATCKSLTFAFMEFGRLSITDLNAEVCKTFFFKFKDTLKKFKCTIQTGGQHLVMDLLNSTTVLETLDINDFTRDGSVWNWSLHQQLPSLRKLVYDKDVKMTNLKIILEKFINVKTLIVWSLIDDIDEPALSMSNRYIASIENMTIKLTRYTLPPFCIICNAVSLTLQNMRTHKQQQRSAPWVFACMIPRLWKLQKLRIQLFAHNTNNVFRDVQKLCTSIKEQGLLRILQISFYSHIRNDTYYEERIKTYLLLMPEHVQIMKMNGKQLR